MTEEKPKAFNNNQVKNVEKGLIKIAKGINKNLLTGNKRDNVIGLEYILMKLILLLSKTKTNNNKGKIK